MKKHPIDGLRCCDYCISSVSPVLIRPTPIELRIDAQGAAVCSACGGDDWASFPKTPNPPIFGKDKKIFKIQ